MKKLLSFISAIAFSSFATSQVMDSQNFNALTAGNVGTNFTGATAGQGSYYLLNGAAADYQIGVVDAAHANSLKINAGAGYVATSDPNNHNAVRLLAVNADPGNDVIKATYSFYTGSANGTGSIYFSLFDDATSIQVIASAIYNVATKTITAGGSLVLNSTGVRGFYGVKVLGTTYPANTWITVGIAYNMTTGAYSWQTPQELYTLSAAPNTNYSLVPGLDIGQYRSYNINASGNTVAYNWAIDDINVSYSNTMAFLATNEVAANKATTSIYPNPVSDVLNVSSKARVKSLQIFDRSGRNISGKTENATQMNVQDLASGLYLINIETENGIETKKFIKK